MLTLIKQRILILAPHTDDGEFGCGGTISRALRNDCEVFYVAFSAAEDSVPSGMDRNILRKEVKEACKSLGIMEANLEILDFKVRVFHDKRQEILDKLLLINNSIKPDIVFVPSTADIHQDHQVVTSEAKRVFKRSILLGYELSWNNYNFPMDLFVKLSKEDVDSKITAIHKYLSQANRNYFNRRVIESQCVARGAQIGADYAESFEVIRICF